MQAHQPEVALPLSRLMLPGVSILVPNWNHELLLPRAIRSALRAARRLRENDIPAEVLVVDDRSRDGSLTLLRQLEALYFDDGLRVLALEQNVGQWNALNLGLRQVTYRYVTLLDADNELLPENQHLFYRSIRQTEAAVVYGNLVWVGQDPSQVSLISNESVQAQIFAGNYVDNCAMVDKYQILDTGGYLPLSILDSIADWENYLHLVANGRKIVFVPVIMGIYHDQANGPCRRSSIPAQEIMYLQYLRKMRATVATMCRLLKASEEVMGGIGRLARPGLL